MTLIGLPAGRRAVDHRPKDGAPTIVVATGVGGEAADWDKVAGDVAAQAGTFRYDRAGLGASDPVEGKRDARAMLDELRLLLDKTNVGGPCLLVGHSFGGLMMQMLARDLQQEVRRAGAMRQEVIGLVLVDSMHPDQYAAMAAALPSAADEPAAVDRMRAYWTEGFRDWRMNPEHIDLPLSMAQAREVATLGDLPLHVMTSGQSLHAPGVPDALRARLCREWDRLHEDLTMLSGRGVHTRHLASGHDIHRDDPAAVAAAIREVLARATSGG